MREASREDEKSDEPEPQLAPSTTFAPFAYHVRSRGAFPVYALLRGLAYSAARSACPKPARLGERLANAPRSRKLSEFGAPAGDDDDLVFDSWPEVLLSSFYYAKGPSLIADRGRFDELPEREPKILDHAMPPCS